MVVRRGRRLFPVRVLKQCGILAAGNWDLDHGNRLAKSGSYTQRRLTHHLVKAPTRFTEVRDLLNSIPQKISTKYTVFGR